jgi:hypothetical protein
VTLSDAVLLEQDPWFVQPQAGQLFQVEGNGTAPPCVYAVMTELGVDEMLPFHLDHSAPISLEYAGSSASFLGESSASSSAPTGNQRPSFHDGSWIPFVPVDAGGPLAEHYANHTGVSMLEGSEAQLQVQAPPFVPRDQNYPFPTEYVAYRYMY